MEHGLSIEEEIEYEEFDGDFFRAAYKSVVLNPSSKLVHGIVTENGTKRIRAWTEKGNTVFDTEHLVTMPRYLFYDDNKVQLTVRYTRDEAYREHVKSGTYGYWHSIFDEFTQKVKNED
jgi:hypothetical protein